MNNSTRFAKIGFISSNNEVPILFNVSKSNNFRNWYIRKFNPYIIKESIIGKSLGFEILLPITLAQAFENIDLFESLYFRTLESLFDSNIKIVSYPPDCNITFPLVNNIENISPQNFLSLFPMEIIEKYSLLTGKKMKNMEILIIDDNGFLAEAIILNTYSHINYLSIITSTDYAKLTKKIYMDNGLNIPMYKNATEPLKSADVVFNLNGDYFKSSSLLKSGSIFVDMSNNKKSFLSICLKRPDVLTIDGLTLSYYGLPYCLEDFELGYYIASKYYKDFKKHKYLAITSKLRKELVYQDIRVLSFSRIGKTITNAHYIAFKNSCKG